MTGVQTCALPICARAGGLGDGDLSICASDFVLAALRKGTDNAHRGHATAKENGVVAMVRGFDDRLKGLGAVELAEDPILVTMKEASDVFVWAGGGLDNLDAMEADADAEFASGPRDGQNVLDASFTEEDLVL